MTDTVQRLFDPDVYGPGPEKRSRNQPPAPVVEAHQDPWVYVRDKVGVKPYAHLPKARTGNGAIITCCGLVGTQLSNEGITQMTRCSECDVNGQLLQLSLAV